MCGQILDMAHDQVPTKAIDPLLPKYSTYIRTTIFDCQAGPVNAAKANTWTQAVGICPEIASRLIMKRNEWRRTASYHSMVALVSLPGLAWLAGPAPCEYRRGWTAAAARGAVQGRSRTKGLPCCVAARSPSARRSLPLPVFGSRLSRLGSARLRHGLVSYECHGSSRAKRPVWGGIVLVGTGSRQDRAGQERKRKRYCICYYRVNLPWPD